MKKSNYLLSGILISIILVVIVFVNKNDSRTNKEGSDNPFFGTVSLTNFNAPDIDFSYAVDSRYAATITKEDLQKANSVVDIVPEKAEWSKITFLNMKIAVLLDEGETTALGDNDILNADQIKLLQATDYSSNFYINARGKRKGEGPEGLKDYEHDEFDLAYYLTIVPEKEAEYSNGLDAMINYLKQNSKEQIAIVTKDQLNPGKVNFTVTQTGQISNVNLLSSSGYASVDERMLALIRNMPGEWGPAENSKGAKVEQEYVFSFGLIGC